MNKDDERFNGANWQVAYLARELRQKKAIAFSCLEDEADLYIKQLSSFSSSYPIMKTKTYKPETREVFLEITNAF